MSTAKNRLGKVLVATGLILGWCVGGEKSAGATLGGDLTSIAANETHLGAHRQVHKLVAGTRHELTLPSGIVVDEFLSPSGVVYGIAWHGVRAPDLREVLGGYFAQLSAPEFRTPSGHHRLILNGNDLVIRAGGHRGSFSGVAWVPSLVPPGVDPRASLGQEVAR